MRRGRKLVISLAALAALASATVGASPSGQAALSQTQRQQLLERRAQLVAQLQQLLPTQAGASNQLLTAEGSYMTAQNGVEAARVTLSSTNKALAKLQQEINADQAVAARARLQLAAVTRSSYESAGDESFIADVMSGQSLTDAMANSKGADTISTDVRNLAGTLSGDEHRLATERAALQAQFAAASAAERDLSNSSNAFMASVADRNSALANASAPVRSLETQIADIDNELAAGEDPTSFGKANGTCGDRFAYGQCTYYVATRRCIPWSGNADQWYANAAAMGYLEGHQPMVGAVVVFWPGGDGASGVGHVGYVEAVGPADGIPAGSFKLSEMNFGGWGRVNTRVLPGNSGGIQGFIYGHR